MNQNQELFSPAEVGPDHESAHKLLGIIAQMNLWIARVDHAVKLEKKAPFEENPRFRSFSSVVSEGVTQFQADHPETPLQYQRLEGFLSLEKFQELLNEPMTQEQLDKVPYGKDFINQFLGKTLRETITELMKLNVRRKLNPGGILIQMTQSFVFSKIERPVADKISGAYAYVYTKAREKMGIPNLDDKNQPIYDELVELYEGTSIAKGEPQSLSMAITFLLEKYNGDLNQTWNMLANFYKYITREEKRVEGAGEWMQTNMLDEFSPHQGYQDLLEKESPRKSISSRVVGIFSGVLKLSNKKHDFWADSSLINQVGKVYHAAYLLSMMEAVDVKVLSYLTGAEFVIYGTGHGPNKAMADALILQNLIKLEQSFTEIISKKQD